MFITKKYLSRRTVLRGIGVSLALPLLDSMVPAQTRLSQTVAAPKSRFACIEICHGSAGSTSEGTARHYWMPEQEGRDFDFSFSLKPLEPYREYVTVISNTDCTNAEAKTPNEEGADHFRSSAVFLSGAHPKQTEGSDVESGTTIDQLYAQQYGQDTPLPSIQLCIENVDASGSCAFQYSCVYMDTISWSSPKTPLPMTIDPRMAFENLFGDGGSAKDRATRQKENKSILDAIRLDTARLQKKIDAQDRARLSTYLDNIREVERRIEGIEKYNAVNPNRELPAAPIGVPDSWEEHVKLMFDLQVLAFSADVTRVSTLKLSRDTINRVFTESGVTTPFHTASHHGESPARVAEYAKLNRYHVGMVGYFIDKLKNTPDGDGSLLDHSLVLYGSPMGDSNVHAHKRVPLVLVGHASGALKGNMNVRAKDGTPQANALLAVINKLGIDQSSIGDSTGAVAI
jgi:hypothetical protein